MSGLPEIPVFWIWFCSIGCFIAQGELVNDYVNDVLELENVPHLKSIPLYANLQEKNIMPDSNGRYILPNDRISALPVGLDFQLLSVNSGMYQLNIFYNNLLIYYNNY